MTTVDGLMAYFRSVYPKPTAEQLERLRWNAFSAIWLFIANQYEEDLKCGVTRPRWVIEGANWEPR